MQLYNYKVYMKVGCIEVQAHSLLEENGLLLARINTNDTKWIAVAGFARGEWTHFTCEAVA